MDRKQFLEKLLKVGICCGAASALFGQSIIDDKKKSTLSTIQNGSSQAWIQDMEKRMIKGSESPDWHKFEKAQKWIKDLMDNMDTILDEGTKLKLMQACGRSCYINAFGVAGEEKPQKEAAERFINSLKNSGGEIKRDGDITTITYSWGRKHQNPQGLIMQDGYCMCPIVETGPPKLSPTYCQCSVGYVKEIFKRSLGKPVKVKLIDSLKMGGKDCIFKIEVKNL